MRRSVAWSFRELGRRDGNAETAMASLRRSLPLVADPALRRQMEDAVQRLARSMGPMPVAGGPMQPVAASAQAPGSPPVIAPGAAPAPPGAQAAPVLDDPGMAYTNEVKSAIVDAMLDFGAPIPIADSQWLTIAARDDHDSRLGGGDPYDVSTIVLRISGADLAAFRAGKITREEALQKVQVREY